jgi:hypothetical protein
VILWRKRGSRWFSLPWWICKLDVSFPLDREGECPTCGRTEPVRSLIEGESTCPDPWHLDREGEKRCSCGSRTLATCPVHGGRGG